MALKVLPPMTVDGEVRKGAKLFATFVNSVRVFLDGTYCIAQR